ncbi:MAG: hypothetical protein PVI06_12590 [Desulfobacterales bacterium]|jgi:hypothetical protein
MAHPMLIGFYIALAAVLFYLASTLALTYLVQQIPRHPVDDEPDWGETTDERIPNP